MGSSSGTVRERLGRGLPIDYSDGTTNVHADFGRFVASLQQFETSSAMSRQLSNKLADEAETFHSSAGTMTAKVRDGIKRIRAGAPIVHYSHQPNLFVGHNVASQAQLIAHAAPPTLVPLCLFIDYDAAGDNRFRTGSLPSFHSDIVRIGGAVSKKDHDRIACSVPMPDGEQITKWQSQFLSVGLEATRAFRLPWPGATTVQSVRSRIDTVRDVITHAVSSSSGLTQLGATLMSQLANVIWDTPVVFVPASRLITLVLNEWFGRPREEHESVFGAGFSGDDLVWVVCPSCFTRTKPQTDCACGRPSGSLETALGKVLVSPAGEIPALVPRVRLCDVLDVLVYRVSGTVSYAGGLDHLVEVRESLHLSDCNVPPAFGWEPHELLTTSPQSVQDQLEAATLMMLQRGTFAALFTQLLALDGGRSASPPALALFG